MKLNTLRPADGRVTRRKRVGRGIGSGLGKTGGRGHKGQTSRSGGSIRPGFEGGQMPLQKRLPKYGFTSRIASVTSQVTLSELDSIDEKVINIEVLKSNGIIRNLTAKVKVFSSGQITKPVVLEGIAVSNGAREAIVSAGGTIKD
ncbi:MAG: 50S ribosomal protein L15 [Porticoccaceae bacterium]|jgi:large subunit ribosomal protein L15|nr:50S ribosomal protein L15 [Porticoccaceae bacterium]MAL68738.1 50S ribosomal protein L15 [Porticoccaceae bacterium]MCH2560834.1 50S ribosomal protein L15 [Pseudomonadales bacterium]GIR39622.1 MAG: 50S ribosomal protein L15 [Porticoccaceae bacterium]|tara:strand:- start:818 stop:1252 length:435 start_codon:yes stop_codon:yes gene_type:complete